MKERNLSLHGREPIRNKKKIIIPNRDEKLIIQRFNESIQRIKDKEELIKILEENHQIKEAMDIRRSQVIFLMSSLDYYMHQIVKYSVIEMFNGNQKKTKEYDQILIPTIIVQNYFQLISSYKIPMQKEKTLTQILV